MSVGFVALQFVLLIVLALLPGTAISWESYGVLIAAAGLALVLWSGQGLGRALTPFPEPPTSGRFTAAGPYRFVRHPMYAGVLLMGIGFAVATHSAPRGALMLVFIAFFYAKSSYEERALRRRYPQYAEYARRTGRFVPRIK